MTEESSMPTLFKMTAYKATSDSPMVVNAENQAREKPRATNKYVIIALSVILTVTVVLTAILVGMYIFTEAQKEIIKYSLSMGGNSRENVTIDPNENIVQYHVLTTNQETWIVNDFNREIQVIKIMTEGKTICYMVPLNKTNNVQPSDVTGEKTAHATAAVTLFYQASSTPVTDQSFLSKSAQILCKAVSTYWLYRTGKSKSNNNTNNNNNNNNLNFTRQDVSKRKRHDIISDNLKIWENDVHTREKRQSCSCNVFGCRCSVSIISIHVSSPCCCECQSSGGSCCCCSNGVTVGRKKRLDNDIADNYDQTTWGYDAQSTTPKRQAPPFEDGSPYYYKKWAEYCESGSCYWVPCVIGCCEEVCSCEIDYFAYIQNGRMYCQWVTKSCPPKISYDPLYYQCLDGPNGMSCPNDPYPHNPPCP